MDVNWIYKRVYDGVNYRLRTLAGGRFAHLCRPPSIIFLLTERCNAHCLHCDIWKNRGKEDSPTFEQWSEVLTDLRRWLGPVQVSFSGGEALLKPYTIDLVRHAHSLGLYLEILTHGYWTDQGKIEELALARPWRVTLSFDGIGETHSRVRGREKFWDKTSTSIETFKRVRKEHGLDYVIRLKNVIMSHNLHDTVKVAHWANQPGMEVFYQPIEQNYNTPEDVRWWEHSENWPKDTSLAIANIRELIRLKRDGLPIANSFAQLEAMIPYFENPESSRVSAMSHSAHEVRQSCNALSTLQFQANGDVTMCTGMGVVGNVKERGIRDIWEHRPRVWESGCCLQRRMSPVEIETKRPVVVAATSE